MMSAKEMVQVHKLIEARDAAMRSARSWAENDRKYTADKICVKYTRDGVKSARKASRKLAAIKACGTARPMSIVFRTVIPLIEEAREFARKDAERTIKSVRAKVKQAGSVEAATPVREIPEALKRNYWASDYKNASRAYEQDMSRRRFFERLMDEEKATLWTEGEVRSAEVAYVAFAGKLETKVGEVTSATLDGSHVWGLSVMTVKTVGGETVKWQTRQIWNRSVLGKVFAQWPTRVIK